MLIFQDIKAQSYILSKKNVRTQKFRVVILDGTKNLVVLGIRQSWKVKKM